MSSHVHIAGCRPRGAIFGIALTSSVLVIKALFATRVGWMLPLVLVLLILAVILATLTLVAPIAPFVYPLF